MSPIPATTTKAPINKKNYYNIIFMELLKIHYKKTNVIYNQIQTKKQNNKIKSI